VRTLSRTNFPLLTTTKKKLQTRSMKRKRKVVKRIKATPLSKVKTVKDYLIIIKSWMFVVVFALMLGIGAVVGTYINTQLEQSTPMVAGAQTEAR